MGSPEQILETALDPPTQSGIGRAVSNLKEVCKEYVLHDGAGNSDIYIHYVYCDRWVF
jgi:hypothetical protein